MLNPFCNLPILGCLPLGDGEILISSKETERFLSAYSLTPAS
jgi:hypothetical protein